MSPIRPIDENGKWGCKQHRVYELDEDGNQLLDADDKEKYKAEHKAELEQQHNTDYTVFKALRVEAQMLWKIKSHIETALKTREKENTHEQSI